MKRRNPSRFDPERIPMTIALAHALFGMVVDPTKRLFPTTQEEQLATVLLDHREEMGIPIPPKTILYDWLSSYLTRSYSFTDGDTYPFPVLGSLHPDKVSWAFKEFILDSTPALRSLITAEVVLPCAFRWLHAIAQVYPQLWAAYPEHRSYVADFLAKPIGAFSPPQSPYRNPNTVEGFFLSSLLSFGGVLGQTQIHPNGFYYLYSDAFNLVTLARDPQCQGLHALVNRSELYRRGTIACSVYLIRTLPPVLFWHEWQTTR